MCYLHVTPLGQQMCSRRTLAVTPDHLGNTFVTQASSVQAERVEAVRQEAESAKTWRQNAGRLEAHGCRRARARGTLAGTLAGAHARVLALRGALTSSSRK